MARLLLVDDDRTLLDALSLALEDAGHTVLTAPDGMVGLKKAQVEAPEIVISDVNMPGLDGFTLCKRLRTAGITVPIVLLTARDTEIDQALGLELGADDYVVKPFSTRVLLARIGALLRREQLRKAPEPEADATVVAGGLELRLERMEARFRDVPFQTTVTEFRLLTVLASRPGVVYTREQLLERIRGDDSVVVDRLVDTYVRRLRRKIEEIDPAFDGIETLVGAGYRWRDASS
jgi:DNA-binding response OmpR family regulator